MLSQAGEQNKTLLSTDKGLCGSMGQTELCLQTPCSVRSPRTQKLGQSTSLGTFYISLFFLFTFSSFFLLISKINILAKRLY